MVKKKLAAMILLLTFFSFVLSACGKEEYKVEYGIDGGIYIPQLIQGPEGIDNLKISGEYLYYTRNSGGKIWRVSIDSLRSGEGEPNFSRGEEVLQVPSSPLIAPEYITDALEKGDFPGFQSGEENGNKVSGVLSLEDYAIDQEQDLYYFVRVYSGDYSSLEDMGGILCKQDKEGGQLYQVYFPDMESMAIDGAGRAYILAGDNIDVMDEEGNWLSRISIGNYNALDANSVGELFGDSEGRVYYGIRNNNYSRKGYEIIHKEGFRLEETNMFSGRTYYSHFAALGGKRILCSLSDEIYEYDRESDSARKIANLMEGGLKGDKVRSAAQVSEDKILLAYGSSGDMGLYLLVRTPIEELDKEYIVIASVSTSLELQDAVTAFNILNSQYKVVIDDYGSEYSEAEGGWNCQILDSSLVSDNPPDILNLERLNIWKYAGKGVLEDLYPYLEESSVFSAGDFLDNVLEGLTIDGRLVCIPGEIGVKCLFGRKSAVGDMDSWTMEDIYRLAEQHPDSPLLFDNGLGVGWDKDYLLGEFCAAYYLDAFVDRDNNKCDFDNEKFRHLLAWVGEHEREPDYSQFMDPVSGDYYISEVYLPEETLLRSTTRLNFDSQLCAETQYGGEAVVKGFPTADGGGKFTAGMTGILSITAGSAHKEGAWKFMEYYLSQKSYALSANKLNLHKAYENAITPPEGITLEELRNALSEGEEIEVRQKGAFYISGEILPYYVISQDQADAVMRVIESADFTPLTEEEEFIIRIVKEEAESYYSGNKTLEEVTGIIQNRAQLLLNERALP